MSSLSGKHDYSLIYPYIIIMKFVFNIYYGVLMIKEPVSEIILVMP